MPDRDNSAFPSIKSTDTSNRGLIATDHSFHPGVTVLSGNSKVKASEMNHPLPTMLKLESNASTLSYSDENYSVQHTTPQRVSYNNGANITQIILSRTVTPPSDVSAHTIVMHYIQRKENITRPHKTSN